MAMDVRDKERLGLGIAVALVLHTGIFVGLAAVDWTTGLPEYSGPVIVELESGFMPLPDPPEPLPQTEEPPPPPPEPERELDMSEPSPPVEQPVVPQTAPAPAPAPRPAPRPAPQTAPQTAPAPQPVDPLARTPSRSIAEIEAEIRGESPSPERTRPVREFVPGDALPDDSPGELPEWVRSIEQRGISTAEIDTRDLRQVAERIEADPAFEAALRRVIEGVEQAARDSGSTPGPREPSRPVSPGANGPLSSSDGSAALSGLRQGRGTPDMEFSFSAQELSALPPTVTIVVAFDVLPTGQVGSLMFVRRSGYTPVDQKVADRIRRWSFSRISGSQTETGYFTLVISREDVTR